MSQFVLSLAVMISCAFADPTPDHLVTAPLAAAPVIAPAVITARSYQVFARNYNALAAPIIAAAPLLPNSAALAAPLIAGAPIVAAEEAPAAQVEIASVKSEKNVQEPTRNEQTEDIVPEEGLSVRNNNASSTAAAARPAVVPGAVVPGTTFSRQAVIPAPAAYVAGTAPYITAPAYPASLPIVAAPFFSSSAATSNYIRFN